MKKLKKRFFLVILILLSAGLAGSITGCMAKRRKEQDGQTQNKTADAWEDGTKQEIVYVPEYFTVDYGGSGRSFAFVDEMFIFDDTLSVVGSRSGQNEIVPAKFNVNLLTGEGSWQDLEEGRLIRYIVRTPEGYLAYVEGYNEERNSMERVLERYDAEFKSIGQVDITSLEGVLAGEGEKLSVLGLGVDKEGRIVVLNGRGMGSLYVLDSEGEFLFPISFGEGTGKIQSLFSLEDGTLLAVCSDGKHRNVLCRVDMEKRTVEEEIEGLPEINFQTRLYPAEGSGLYVYTDDALYLYDMETHGYEELLKWVEIGISGDGPYKCCGTLGDGRFVMALGEHNNSSGEVRVDMEFVVLTPTPADKVKPRTELTLAVMEMPFGSLEDKIVKFNRYNPDYCIKIKVYGGNLNYNDEDYKQQYEQALYNFNNDMITGETADLFWANGNEIDLDNLAVKGALTDLYEFMDKDGEVGREDYIPNILGAMEKDEKLYFISPEFSLNTLVGKEEHIGKYEEWSYAAISDAIKGQPEMRVTSLGKAQTLWTFARYSRDLFYDEETGECNFASQEFIELLKLAEEYSYSSEYTQYNPAQMVKDNEVLLNTEYISWFSDIQMIQAVFGEDAVFAGYPTKKECGAVINFIGGRLAICALSKNKQGAWEFIRSFITYEAQKDCSNFPISRKVFEEFLGAEMEAARLDNYSYGSLQIKVEPLTGERAEIIRDMVYSAAITGSYDSVIDNIINEEAAAYFAGSKSAEETADHIQGRVQLYLDEQR